MCSKTNTMITLFTSDGYLVWPLLSILVISVVPIDLIALFCAENFVDEPCISFMVPLLGRFLLPINPRSMGRAAFGAQLSFTARGHYEFRTTHATISHATAAHGSTGAA